MFEWAERVKLAKELARASTGDTVYILDEPTTSLHFADIQKLLDVLHRLTDAGNTVLPNSAKRSWGGMRRSRRETHI